MKLELILVSSLEKVFLDEEPRAFDGRVEGFRNEEVSFQVAWTMRDTDATRDYFRMRVISPISSRVRVRLVRQVPVRYPAPIDADDYYLRKTPGLYPDLLVDASLERVSAWNNQWASAWLDVVPDDELLPGDYPITVEIHSMTGEILASASAVYSCLPALLPKQKLIHTKWFHSDALCEYYSVPMCSDEFFRIAENFVRAAVRRSINMLLTPVHTPPLDTAVGGERLTCQLVDIQKTGDKYSFGFKNLRRWVDMALNAGIEYFEMAHLFTQWGAKHAPKIMAVENGELKRIFGWETDATGDDYVNFLNQYLPALTGELKALGIADRCYFHISDEPAFEVLPYYAAAKRAVAKLLEGFTIIDALSDFEFYSTGTLTKPVPANNHIRPFLDAGVKGLWTYYCVGQYKRVSNTFMAMPGARTRIMGAQMYKYNIEGFLQWGYNFYNSILSEYSVNPYIVTDGDGFTPSGDCFQVYPGKGGVPEESIRMLIFAQGVYDMRALCMLESLRGREFTMSVLEDGIPPIEFDSYPKGENYLLNMRRRVNAEILKALKDTQI